jgi:hypothetical protein
VTSRGAFCLHEQRFLQILVQYFNKYTADYHFFETTIILNSWSAKDYFEKCMEISNLKIHNNHNPIHRNSATRGEERFRAQIIESSVGKKRPWGQVSLFLGK